MRHKRFNEPLPYTYFIIHKKTGLAYYGVRIANSTRLNTSPSNDLCKNYFTSLGKHSAWFKQALIKDSSAFIVKVHYTFDEIEEAYFYESCMIQQLISKKLWINKVVF